MKLMIISQGSNMLSCIDVLVELISKNQMQLKTLDYCLQFKFAYFLSEIVKIQN